VIRIKLGVITLAVILVVFAAWALYNAGFIDDNKCSSPPGEPGSEKRSTEDKKPESESKPESTDSLSTNEKPGEESKTDATSPKGRRYTGHVLDENGSAIAGARLYSPFEGQTMGRSRGLIFLNTETGTDGRFEVPGAEFKSWHEPLLKSLVITRNGYLQKGIDLNAFPRWDNAVDLGDIVLKQGLAISGQVADDSGNPVENATVVAGGDIWFYPMMKLSADKLQKTAITGKDGSYRVTGLKPGTWILRAFSAEHTPATSEPVKLADNDIPNIDFVLAGAGEITGTVVYTSDNKPVPGCIVAADRTMSMTRQTEKGQEYCHTMCSRTMSLKDPFDHRSGEDWQVIEEFYKETLTDAQGRFVIRGIPLDGKFTVIAKYPEKKRDFICTYRSSLVFEEKNISAGQTVKFDIARLASLSGEILCFGTGKPFTKEFEIRASSKASNGVIISYWFKLKRKDGKYRIDKFIYPGQATVTVLSDGYFTVKKDCLLSEGGQAEDLNFSLKPIKGNCRVTGSVTDAETSQPLSGAEVVVHEEIRGYEDKRTKTDEDGRFEVAGLVGSDSGMTYGHRIGVNMPGYLEGGAGGTFEGGNQAEYEIQLKRGETIKGIVIMDDGSSPVGVYITCRSTRSRRPGGGGADRTLIAENRSGEFELLGLPPDDYMIYATVMVMGKGAVTSKTVRVKIPCDDIPFVELHLDKQAEK
jgi:protocatechuate 3,4-dioxygenase beta subunit